MQHICLILFQDFIISELFFEDFFVFISVSLKLLHDYSLFSAKLCIYIEVIFVSMVPNSIQIIGPKDL